MADKRRGGIWVWARYTCAFCPRTEEAWIPRFEEQPGTSKHRPDGWMHTHENGMVCPACFEERKLELHLVPRGL